MHAEVLFLPAQRAGVSPGDKAGQDENVAQLSGLPHTVFSSLRERLELFLHTEDQQGERLSRQALALGAIKPF